MRPWQLIALTALVGALAISVNWKPFWVLFYALLIALALSIAWLALSVRGLTFNRSALGGRAQVGERIEERLALENHSWMPKLWVQVVDGSTLPGHHAGYVSSVGPHQRIAWRARTVCRRRGRYTLGPVVATTGDPLGLFRRELTLAPEHQLLVLPSVLNLNNFHLYPGVMPGRGRGSQRSLQTTTNIVTVRNYVPGDALTRIHWPSTARHSQFMVKEFDLDPTIDVVILLDFDRDAQAGENESSTEEYGVTITASIASYLLRQQELSVALAVTGAPDASLALDRGERQLDRILEALAVAHPRRAVPLAVALAEEEQRLARNTVLIIVTPSTELDWTQGLAHLRQRGVRPLVILLDPHSFDDQMAGNTAIHDALVATGTPVVAIHRGDALIHVLEEGA
ncbi:MAG: DUF58 domain-containing protein [Ktedonobacterales bacterium]